MRSNPETVRKGLDCFVGLSPRNDRQMKKPQRTGKNDSMNTFPEEKPAYQKRLNREFKELFVLTRGRIHRVDYFLISMLLKGLGDLVELIPTGAWWGYVIAIPLELLSIYIGICVTTKRLRDIGLSGWFLIPVFLLISIGFVGMGRAESTTYIFSSLFVVLLPSLILVFWPPQRKDNKYGPYDEYSILGGAGIYNKKKAKKPQGE
jgi:uncharacterized membrane protein YhaH (DUF805 family)